MTRAVSREVSARVSRLVEDFGQLQLDWSASAPSFGVLAQEWLVAIRPRRVDPRNEERAIARLEPLFGETEATLTGAKVEDAIDAVRQAEGFGATYLNKLRSAGKLAVAYAQKRGVWHRPNPFELARRLREFGREYELLSLAELELVQKRIPKRHRALFRVAVHLGLRPGELFALRVEDVDFTAGVVRVRRSHGRNATKTGRARVVPIVDAVLADLRKAVDRSPSGIVFPGAHGGRQEQHRATKLTRMLRTAMAAAGVGVVGALYWCSRPRLCGWREERAGQVTPTRCPRCGRRCNTRPRVRAVRWYDLRHSCATLHHHHGADPLCVALALGHAVRGTTQAVYTHPAVDVMRAELSKWRINP